MKPHHFTPTRRDSMETGCVVLAAPATLWLIALLMYAFVF